MIKVGHFSDLHYCEKNLEEADRCFGFAVEAAIQRGIDVAVISGDATDHALDVHSPAVVALARRVLQLANHCPVLMLQGTFSHEPPGTLAIFPLLGGRHPIHVADRISQVSLSASGRWTASDGWRFDGAAPGSLALFTCVPTVNKAAVAAVAGASEAAEAQGRELAALLAGYGQVNQQARAAGVPTIGVSHGTVSGCVTEHGVPMAGFDHEFTVASLLSAQAQAFMLGHIHRHQHWEKDGRLVGYAGSIGRFHHGELGEKGFVAWQVGAASATLELVPTPSRRTVDLFFEGKPDLGRIQAAVAEQGLQGAHIRVRWVVADEDRHDVDRDAICRLLEGAADVQLEGRMIPVVRSRAAGISRCASLEAKVTAWCEVSNVEPLPVLERLAALGGGEPAAIAADLLAVPKAAEDRPAAPLRETQQPEFDLFGT
ncbi:metallophosphoesterase family protein [Roseateles aquatilis]|jgi:exonuclease SbcD|uniref:metallophosphoesterase family protein n=1 Tax=Roseateles aquatilis TaxID=431061 RepID=UPI001EDE6E2E|nr:metallophosphatase family protein [Roseateles aquatilis]